MAESIHARCFTLDDKTGAFCRKSKGHTASEDPQRKRHYDPDEDYCWPDEQKESDR